MNLKNNPVLVSLLGLTIIFSGCTPSGTGAASDEKVESATVSPVEKEKGEKSPPNVVFVITDDQGYGDLGCTGNARIKTPNTDKLANESIWLTDYHVAPTCSPTRAALMSGHWTNRTGVWHTIHGTFDAPCHMRERLVNSLKKMDMRLGCLVNGTLVIITLIARRTEGFTEVYRHGGGGGWTNS